MANTVLIIGNGFDIDLGLKSKYSDFILGSEWKNVCELIKERFPEKFHTISLLMHLLGASGNKKLWFDVEYEIHEFIKKYPIKVSQISDSHSGLAKKEFILLRKTLADYLKRITTEFILDKSKWSYQLLKALEKSNDEVKIFTFNYTNICKLCKIPQLDVTYIHGCLEDDDIILGCERIGLEFFPKPFNFLRKSDMVSRPNNIIIELLEANEVIFFGHSLNVFDYTYFEEFFSSIRFPIEHKLNLTFITRNQNSESDIRDNLRDQGIPVQNLFKSNIKTTFIHTAPEDSEMSSEQDKWNILIQRIKEK